MDLRRTRWWGQVMITNFVVIIYSAQRASFTKVKVSVTQPCPTFCDPMDCSSPGSFVHGILQARILEWVAILFSKGSSQPRDWTWVSLIAGRFFAIWATRETDLLFKITRASGYYGGQFQTVVPLTLVFGIRTPITCFQVLDSPLHTNKGLLIPSGGSPHPGLCSFALEARTNS